jgi:hypothetical protein
MDPERLDVVDEPVGAERRRVRRDQEGPEPLVDGGELVWEPVAD